MRTAGLCFLSAVLAFFLGRFSFESGQEPGVRASSPVGTELGSPASPLTPPAQAHSAGPPRERLVAALEGDDPLLAAQRVQAWIDSASASDFQALVADGTKLIEPRFSGFGSEFRRAFFEALATRWFEVDPDGAISGMLKVRARTAEYIAWEWLEGAARARPDLVLTHLPVLRSDQKLEPYAAAAFRTLANRSPAQARSFLDGIESIAARRFALEAIAHGVADSDPVAAVTMARELKLDSTYAFALESAERIGPGVVRQLIASAPERFGAAWYLPRLLLRYPGIAAELLGQSKPAVTWLYEQTRMTADRMTPKERQCALGEYESTPPGVRETTVAAVVSAWARTEPAQAAEWALAHSDSADPNAPANRGAREVMQRWIRTDPNAGLAWWRSLPPSPLRDALGMSATVFFAEQGRFAEALELFRPGELNQEDWRVAADLTGILAESDPATAVDWFSSIPEKVVAGPTARALMTSWMSRHPEAARSWLESLPPSLRRDEAARVYIERTAEDNPGKAAETVLTVEDPQLRQQASLWVYWKMRANDTEAAERWFRELPGVDEQWRARILRTRRGTYTYFTSPNR